jgi:hypothetical protein
MQLTSLTPFETWKIPQKSTNAIQKTNVNTNTEDKGQQESTIKIEEVGNVQKRRKRKKQKNQSSLQKQTTPTTPTTTPEMNDLTKVAHKRKFEETK